MLPNQQERFFALERKKMKNEVDLKGSWGVGSGDELQLDYLWHPKKTQSRNESQMIASKFV